MGILAKENMLYFLAFGIVMCLLVPVLIFADEQRIDFFKECRSCSGKTAVLKEENHSANRVILFIRLDNSASDAAVKDLVRFKKDYPAWIVKGVIVADKVNLKNKLIHNLDYFKHDTEFSIDLTGSLSRESGVSVTPAYVVTYQGRFYKFEGREYNLNDIISKFNQ